MKIITFLFMFVIALSQVNTDLQAESVLASQVTTSQTRNSDGTYSLQIDVSGEHSFTTTLPPTSYRISINQTTTDGTHFILYGYTTENYNHDSLFIVLNNQGEILQHKVLKNTLLSEIVKHYHIDESLIFKEVLSSIEDRADYQNEGVRFFKLDETFNISDQIIIDNAVDLIVKQDPYIFIQERFHEPYTMALDKNLTVYKDDVIYGVSNHQTYQGEVDLFFLDTLFFNNHTHTNFLTIDYPGHYQIPYQGTVINFTLDPIIEGVIHNTIYQEAVTITVPKGRLLLNNELYLSGETIKEPGIYKLLIEGANDYEKTLEFTITTQLNGVFNNQAYDSYRTLEFNGVGFLNGRYIENGHIVEDAGSYTLEIHGENDYLETVNFELNTNESSNTSNPTLIIEIILIAIVILIAGGVIVKTKFF